MDWNNLPNSGPFRLIQTPLTTREPWQWCFHFKHTEAYRLRGYRCHLLLSLLPAPSSRLRLHWGAAIPMSPHSIGSLIDFRMSLKMKVMKRS